MTSNKAPLEYTDGIWLAVTLFTEIITFNTGT
jgi:hypothetical protein